MALVVIGDGVATHQVILARELVIDLEIALVERLRQRVGNNRAVGHTGYEVRIRQIGQEKLGLLGDSGVGNHVVGKRPAPRVGERLESGEVSLALRGASNHVVEVLSLAQLRALEVHEEECLVAPDGPSQRSAHLIAMQRLIPLVDAGGRGKEEVPRIHGIVVEKPVDVAIGYIRPSLESCVKKWSGTP